MQFEALREQLQVEFVEKPSQSREQRSGDLTLNECDQRLELANFPIIVGDLDGNPQRKRVVIHPGRGPQNDWIQTLLPRFSP